MNYWMDYELKRIGGHPDPYPEHAALSWPSPEAPYTDIWRKEVAHFVALLNKLAELAMTSPEALARPIPANHSSEAQHASSLESVLWQTLAHNSYHLGQVVQMRQVLGAWPPHEGSDTW